MKVVIAGGRDFKNYPALDMALQPILVAHGWKIEIVSGKARGADTLGEQFAEQEGLTVKEFPADWETNGRSAGPIRNAEMADYADILISFWDSKSKGTKSMIDLALKKGLEVHVYRY